VSGIAAKPGYDVPMSLANRAAGVLGLWMLLCGHAAISDARVPDDGALAQRFRPYYKFSLVKKAEEPCRPCSWQWFAAHSRLMRGDQLLIPREKLAGDPARILTAPDADLRTTQSPTDPLMLRPGKDAWEGEPWPAVIDDGAGLYCQCEDARHGLVVLTYWTLFGYNKTTVSGDHEGDIIAVVVVYSRRADRLIRATFGMHGRVIESFNLPAIATADDTILHGYKVDGSDESIDAKWLHIPASQCYQSGPIYYVPTRPSDVCFVKDPKTHRFEHLAVFCEWGSHEPWPNPHGSFAVAPSHAGDGISFLPGKVRCIGSFTDPEKPEIPMVYFNGHWGTAAAGFAFHRACFYPGGRAHNPFHIPETAFADRDPFAGGTLRWPPVDENESATK
jgi:hypothetical protein